MAELVDLVKDALVPLNKRVRHSLSSAANPGSQNNERKRKRGVTQSDEAIKTDPIVAILSHCSENPDSYESLWYYISSDLSKKRSENILRALEVLDTIFHNSRHFRKVLNNSIDVLLRCTGVTDPLICSQRHRESSDGAKVYHKAVELLAVWDYLYGTELAKIHTMARYMKESLGIDVPNISKQLEELQKQREECERVRREKIYLQSERIRREELDDALKECNQEMDNIDHYFKLLFPMHLERNDDYKATTEGEEHDDIEWQHDEVDNSNDLASSSLLASAPFTIEINIATSAKDLKNSDNEVLIQAIEEAAAVLAKTLVPRLWNLQKDLIASRSHHLDDLGKADRGLNSVNVARSREKIESKVKMEEQSLNSIQMCLGRAKELLSNRCKTLLC